MGVGLTDDCRPDRLHPREFLERAMGFTSSFADISGMRGDYERPATLTQFRRGVKPDSGRIVVKAEKGRAGRRHGRSAGEIAIQEVQANRSDSRPRKPCELCIELSHRRVEPDQLILVLRDDVMPDEERGRTAAGASSGSRMDQWECRSRRG